MSFLPYAKQSIDEQDIQSVSQALKEELITRGPLVQQFEEAVAAYCAVPYAVAFNSGTAALMAAYFAADLQPYDKVISTANTFIASISAPLQMKIRPQFLDIERSTGNFNLHQLKEKLRIPFSRGRPFIVPVHFSGLAVDMAALDRLICHPETVVIEDAAHALGSLYPTGEKVGSCAYSQMTIFSFHPAKTLTTGEGGMVTTRDPKLYQRLRLFRDNGIVRDPGECQQKEILGPGYYEVQAITGNYNFTSFQAALGLSQLQRLPVFIEKRRALVNRYRSRLKDMVGIRCFSDGQDKKTAFHLFVAQIDFQAYGKTREEVIKALKEKGIGTQVHYIPLYKHPVLKEMREECEANCPEMEDYYQQALSLPLYSDLTKQEVDRVCETLLKILK